MKFFSATLMLSLSCLLFFTACDQLIPQNKDLALKVIPSEASSVTAFRIPQIMEKADFEAFKKLPVYQKMVREAKEDNPTMAQIVADPAKSGVDLTQNIYSFSQLGTKNPEQVLTAMVMPLADADAFTAMVEEMRDGNIQQEDGYQMLSSRKNGYLLWNESLALVAMLNNSQADVSEELAAILKGGDNSVADDRNLQKCLSQDHDIVTWLSSNAISNFKDAQMMIAGMGFDPDALQDNYIHGYLNFEQGQVTGHSDLLLRKALTKDLDLLFKSEVNTDFSPYVPAENLGMVFSAALDFKGLNQILAERPQSKGFVNYALKEYGLTTNDVAKALGGDLLVAVYAQAEEPSQASGLFITDIDDRSVFNKFLELATDYNAIEKVGDDYFALLGDGKQFNRWINPHTLALSDGQPHLLLAHDKLFISANTDLLQTIKTGGFKKSDQLPKDLNQQIQDNLFSALLNFELLNDFLLEEDLPLKNLNIKAERRSFDFDLQLEDQKNNSLKTLLWMMNEAYEKEQLKMGEGKKAI